MTRRVVVALEVDEYLNSCARIRDLSVTALMLRVLKVISKDQMIAAILDDADCLQQRQPREHGYRKASHQPVGRYPL